MRKLWDIHGGVHPPENKQQSVQTAIGQIALPGEFVLPLNQHIGAPATPAVAAGDKVLKGQVLADAQGIFSARLHAPTSGTITAIEDRVIAHPSGMTATCIILRPDGEDRWTDLTPCPDPDGLDHFELVERIRAAGLAGLGGAGFPTAVKLNPRTTDRVHTLILNGTECEPYITADDMLMREHAEGVIRGAELLARIVGNPEEILVGIEDNKPEAIAAMREAARNTRVEIVVFPTKYPSGGEKQLIQILTGKEVPSGKIPAQIGVLVQNVGTAFAAWRAVRYGEPLIERVTTVVGEALQQQRNIWARIGTPVKHILAEHGFNTQPEQRLIFGGPMMGFAVAEEQVPVVKTTNCILAPSAAEMPEPPLAQACIRCGLCAEACPAQLLPQQLYWYAQAEDYDKLTNHNLFDCIECGACSYVCPSAIPLVQYYRAAKGEIRHQELEKEKADRARVRFEQRKERIAKAEAEKEAKRAARKKAAEEAKRQLAEKAQAQGEQTDASAPSIEASSDMVARAVARAKDRNQDPEQQRKKLERTLSSAQSRVERLQQQLAQAEGDASASERLAATLKQAELKVEEAQQKLHAFNQGEKPPKDEATTAVPPTQPSDIAVRQADPQQGLARARERVEKLQQRVADAQARGDDDQVAALERSLAKQREKLSENEQALAHEEAEQQTASSAIQAAETDAAALAIAKAKAKAQAASEMSPEEKRRSQIASMESRLNKARERLAKAEAENSEHVDTLRNSVRKLEDKLAQLQASET